MCYIYVFLENQNFVSVVHVINSLLRSSAEVSNHLNSVQEHEHAQSFLIVPRERAFRIGTRVVTAKMCNCATFDNPAVGRQNVIIAVNVNIRC
jgi:hypothetical protein